MKQNIDAMKHGQKKKTTGQAAKERAKYKKDLQANGPKCIKITEISKLSSNGRSD